MSGRTTILIAHRLSTVRGADRIYVIDRGQVVETGSHATLVRRGDLYARLASGQELGGVA
jgi:subfamily B ATP-binding cassette protein MsbA